MFWNEVWFTRQCVFIAYTNSTMSNEYEWSLWIDNEMIMKMMSDDWGETQGKWVDEWHDEMTTMREKRTNEWNEKQTKRNESEKRNN